MKSSIVYLGIALILATAVSAAVQGAEAQLSEIAFFVH
jgi:hypothetical protein